MPKRTVLPIDPRRAARIRKAAAAGIEPGRIAAGMMLPYKTVAAVLAQTPSPLDGGRPA